MRKLLFPLLVLLLIAAAALLSPAEGTLGANARLVYVHGAMVWVAIGAFAVAGGLGLVGLLTRAPRWAALSTGWARTGLLLWLVQTPLSLVVMQQNWGGLFLDEPRWRVSLTFAIVGLLVQAALILFNHPLITSAANLAYGVVLLVAMRSVVSVMHPESPILNSDAGRIQVSFAILAGLWAVFAWGVQRVLSANSANLREKDR